MNSFFKLFTILAGFESNLEGTVDVGFSAIDKQTRKLLFLGRGRSAPAVLQEPL
jgi:hypothetical protein